MTETTAVMLPEETNLWHNQARQWLKLYRHCHLYQWRRSKIRKWQFVFHSSSMQWSSHRKLFA